MKKVEFIKEFATKKKGDSMDVDPMLARDLVNRKVAKFAEKKSK